MCVGRAGGVGVYVLCICVCLCGVSACRVSLESEGLAPGARPPNDDHSEHLFEQDD